MRRERVGGSRFKHMVWCRKIWKEITSLRCESCPEAVEVRRQFLCGREPGTPPDHEAIVAEEARIVSRKAEAKSRATPRRGAAGLSVHMRDKRGTGPAKPSPAPKAATADAPEPAAAESPAPPGRPSRATARRRGARRGRPRVGGAGQKRPTAAAESKGGQPPVSSPSADGAQAAPPKASSSGRGRRRPGRGPRRKSGQRPSPPAQRAAGAD